METRKLLVKKLSPNAVMPKYASSSAAGADIYACIDEGVAIAPGETALIPTGIALRIPDGYAGFVFARSGLATKNGIAPANKVGVIDSDYRGELMISLYNQSAAEYTVMPGERIAQLVIMPVVTALFEEAGELDVTERGNGGFGSTGSL